MLAIWRYVHFACLVLVFAGTVQAAEPEKFALLVGVDTYKSQNVTSLKGPTNDVKIMRELLVKTYGFKDDPDHITVLAGSSASVGAIGNAFRSQLIEKAKAHPNAMVVFYFSGHGSVITDHNNDEGDGIDETLVAYDSRSPGGVDIVDDEIDVWFDELRRYTSDATFILDSCHSGTATRGPDIVARELPSNLNMGGAVSSRGLGDGAGSVTPKALQFIAVAGALANELSYEGDDIPGAKGIWHGYLTWSLVQTLNSRPDVTWRQALVQTGLAMAKIAPAQHPQVEGDIDRIVFDGAGGRAQPHISINRVESNGVLTVDAGAPQGLGVGSVVAIYAAKARTLSGPEYRLATARVTEVGVTRSKAVVDGKPNQAIPLDAKVAIMSVSEHAQPLLIKLDTLADQSSTQADLDVLAKVRAMPAVKGLVEGGRIRLTTGKQQYLYAVQRGCLGPKSELQFAARGEPATGCRGAWYIATLQTRQPAFGYWVTTDDPQAAAKLAVAIERLENQADLRSQVNTSSRLKVALRLMDVVPQGSGAPLIRAHSPGQQPVLKTGDKYTFEMENQSAEDVYVTLLVAGTSGAVFPLTASANGELLRPGARVLLQTALTAGPPSGIETYKLMAANSPVVNFRKWDASGLRIRDPSKDPSQAGQLRVDDWTTAQLDIEIVAQP